MCSFSDSSNLRKPTKCKYVGLVRIIFTIKMIFHCEIVFEYIFFWGERELTRGFSYDLDFVKFGLNTTEVKQSPSRPIVVIDLSTCLYHCSKLASYLGSRKHPTDILVTFLKIAFWKKADGDLRKESNIQKFFGPFVWLHLGETTILWLISQNGHFDVTVRSQSGQTDFTWTRNEVFCVNVTHVPFPQRSDDFGVQSRKTLFVYQVCFFTAAPALKRYR